MTLYESTSTIRNTTQWSSHQCIKCFQCQISLWMALAQVVLAETSLTHCCSRRDYFTTYDIQCHQFYLSCSILIVNRGIVSPTLSVNPTLLVISCHFWGDYRITVLQLLSLTKWFSSKFQPSMTVFVPLLLRSVIHKVTIVTLHTIWH